MIHLDFNGQRLSCQPGENLLDCLLRHDQRIPYGCRAGACQACLVQLRAGEAPAQASRSLTASQRQQGLLMSCLCEARQGLALQSYDSSSQRISARIIDKTLLSADVLRLRLNARLRWRAGQYLNIWADEQQARSYSIASVASLDDYIELHVRRYDSGLLSPRLFHHCQVGDTLSLQGPMGEFSYGGDQPQQALLMLAQGTGLAPLLGIARDALAQGHQGTIRLIAVDADYGDPLLANLAQQSADAEHVLVNGEDPLAAASHHLKHSFPALRGWHIYLCGGARFVTQLQRQCFIQGASQNNIHTETFLDFHR